MKIWILIDDRIGSNNQSIALAEKISNNYIQKNIVYNTMIFLPNFIRRDTTLGIDLNKSDKINSDFPDILICAGRRLSSLALYIKKKSNGKTFVINIMNPNLSYGKFDTILLPKHDMTPKHLLEKNKNIIETFGSINRINTEKISAESNKWKDFFLEYKKPFVSLIIGGDTKNYKFDAVKFGEMVKNLSNITKELNGTLLITTSRRTSDQCLDELKTNLICDYYLYDWKQENNPENKFKNELGNPYFAFLGSSDFLVVTGDSMSMISESCSTGTPVYVYMPKESLGKKHMRFCEELIKSNYIKEFDKSTKKLEKYIYKPLNEAKRISTIIIKEIKK